MNTDPMVSSRLHAVDQAWPIDEEEQFQRFEAGHTPRVSRPTHTPDKRNRVFTAAVAFAVFLLGGVFTWRAFQPGGRPAPAATPSATQIQASVSTFGTGLRFLEGAVVADGSVWVAGSNGNSDLGQLVRIDPSTGDVITRIDVPVPGWEFGGAGITAARGSVWILASPPADQKGAVSGSWLYRIDPATNSVAEATRVADEEPSDIWVNDTGIWILTWSGSDHMTVSSLDPETYALVQSTRLQTSWSQTVAHAGGHVWVFGSTEGDAPAETLFELDPETLAQTDTLQPTGGRSFLLTVSGDRIWFHNQGLHALDASTGQEDVGPLGHVNDCCAALTPDGTGGVWILDPSGANPGLWHVDTDGVIDSIDETSFGSKVDGNASAFDPASNTIWIVHYDGTVTRVDIRSDVRSSSPAEETEPATTGDSFLAPYLSGGQGWNSRSSEPVPAKGRSGTVAWASTIPISQDDVRLGAAIPPTTITDLPPDGIVVTVEVLPAAFYDTSVPFPYADLSFDLTAATRRGAEAEEPAGDYSVLQMEDRDSATLVRVYFGSPNPAPELIAKAQAELDTLQLPPTCTVGGEGSYSVSVSATEAAPGDSLTLTGRVPFQQEDGSYDESGDGQLVAWWNVAPKDWVNLVSGSPSPSPAVQGEGIVELGAVPMSTCMFAIPFTIPDVAPGDYPALVLQEGGGSATLEGSVVVHVTGP